MPCWLHIDHLTCLEIYFNNSVTRMFSNIFRKAISKNSTIDQALPDEDKEMFVGLMDGILGQFDGVMDNLDPETLEGLKTQFEDGLAEHFDKITPDLANAQAEMLNQSRDMLAKWRWRMSKNQQHVPFDELNDWSVARAELEREEPSKKKIDKELKRLVKKDEASWSELIRVIVHGESDAMMAQVKACIKNGCDVNMRTFLMDTPLAFAYDFVRYDVMGLLVDHGADLEAIGWDELHRAIAWGSVADVKAALPCPILMRPDERNYTALELAADIGDAEKFELVLDQVIAAVGYEDQSLGNALVAAAGHQNSALTNILLDSGVPVDALDKNGQSAVWVAVNMQDIDVLELLLEHGADLSGIDELSAYSDHPERKMTDDGTPAIVVVARMLVAAGWDPAQLDNLSEGELRFVTGAAGIAKLNVSTDQFHSQSQPRDGLSNPEQVDIPFWNEMIRTGASAYSAAEKHGKGSAQKVQHPVWCYDRYGQSTTRLPDGRWVQVGGEHEDSYDQDFHIYNDVVVHDGKGGVQVFVYPKDVFPPTDFHSATLLEGRIILIGSVGYMGSRQIGETQVLSLDLNSFAISTVTTTGEKPGWINRHTAEHKSGEVIVSGGQIQSPKGYHDFEGQFALRLSDMSWRNLDEDQAG